MLFHGQRKRITELCNLKVGKHNIKRSKYVNFLGVLMDEYLSWNIHTTDFANQAHFQPTHIPHNPNLINGPTQRNFQMFCHPNRFQNLQFLPNGNSQMPPSNGLQHSQRDSPTIFNPAWRNLLMPFFYTVA